MQSYAQEYKDTLTTFVLQHDVDRVPRPPRSKALSTVASVDGIRASLHQQKRAMHTLQHNKIYKELLNTYPARPESAGSGKQQMREMDGRMRMFDSLRQVAAKEQYSRRGVWSITGEPYQCYGEPEQVMNSMPSLLKYEVKAAQAVRAQAKRQAKEVFNAAAAKRSRPTSAGSTGHRATWTPEEPPSSAGDGRDLQIDPATLDRVTKAMLSRSKAVLLTNADRREASFPRQVLQMAEERAQLSQRTGRGFMSADAANTDAEDPLQWDEHLSNEDGRRITASRVGQSLLLPARLTKQRGPRSGRSALAASFSVSGESAHATPTAKAFAGPSRRVHSSAAVLQPSGGSSATLLQPTLDSDLQPVLAGVGAGSGGQPGSHPLSTPLPGELAQESAAQSVSDGASPQGGLPTAASEAHVLFQTGGLYQTGRRRSSDVQSTPGTVGGGTMRTSYGATQAMTRHAALPPTPDFTDLVHNRRAALGQENDPVRQWHDAFVAVRQRQRHHLQHTLWERAQRRQAVRSSTPHAAGFCELVLRDLQASKGRASRAQPRPGEEPESLLAQTEALIESRMAAIAAEMPAVELTQADKIEVEVISNFYDSLCRLVMSMKAVDTLSLVLVEETKRLLETGSVLRPSLVLQLLEDVSFFATRSGLNKQPAPFLLPLFTFMRKCVGLEEHTFFRQCQRLGCGPLIYGAEELSRQEQVPGSQAATPMGKHSFKRIVSGQLQQTRQKASIGGPSTEKPAGAPQAWSTGMRQKTMSKAHWKVRLQDLSPDAGTGPAEASHNSLEFIKETPEET